MKATGPSEPAGRVPGKSSSPRFEAALEAVEARLEAIRSSGDPALALGPDADREVRALRRARGRDPELRAAFALGWLYWFRQDAGRARAELAPCFVRGLEPLPDDLVAGLAIASCFDAALTLNKALNQHDRHAIAAAVALWRRIWAVIPEDADEWPKATAMLGVALQGSFEAGGPIADLDEALGLAKRGLETAGSEGPRLSLHLIEYGNGLILRFNSSGDRDYLDKGIEVMRQAVAELPGKARELAGLLANLAVALRLRFESFGELADLEDAVDTGRAALAAAPVLDRERFKYWTGLAAALRTRYLVADAPEDLAEAIELLREAVDFTTAARGRRAERVVCLSNLAVTLFAGYEALPEATAGLRDPARDLDEVIRLLRKATDLAGPQDPVRALLLSNLSVAVMSRYQRTGSKADLDAAVEIGGLAVASAYEADAGRARYYSNLCTFLRSRGDYESAVTAGQRAVELTGTDSQEWTRRLSNLANAQRDAGETDAAIKTLRQALDPEYPEIAANLGVVLISAGRPDEAIAVLRPALDDAPDGYLRRPAITANLASAYRQRFAQSGSDEDRRAALRLFAEISDAASAGPSTRVRSARAAFLAADLADQEELSLVARLLGTAVELLPAIVPRRLSRGDQQDYLADFGGLARDAAALALASGGANSLERALTLLETGRGVLLSQALETRGDLSALRLLHPRLAARFVRLSRLLDAGPGDQVGQPVTADLEFAGAALSLEQRAGDRQRLAADFAVTVDRIRRTPGFAGFMRSPDLTELLAQARIGAVVVLNVSDYRSDAIVLTSDAISNVPLPGLGQASAWERVRELREDFPSALPEILDWLWENVTGPVLRALGLDGQARGQLPRLWWVAGGPLSLLPIHAAGPAMDRVISSYVPTVRSLAFARAAAGPPAIARSLIVSVRNAPGGAPPLDEAPMEARQVARLLPSPRVLPEPDAAQVMRNLAGQTIAHFACHGVTHPVDPSRSGLLLADRTLTVAELAALRLKDTRLAYLSACATAVSDTEELADEAIHVASAFQLAGFPQVVGTLWPIGDHGARIIATAFYKALLERPGSGYGNAAEALHQATSRLRADYPHRPEHWASHIHVGA